MIPAGKYEYTIKGKLGTKKGIIDFKEGRKERDRRHVFRKVRL